MGLLCYRPNDCDNPKVSYVQSIIIIWHFFENNLVPTLQSLLFMGHLGMLKENQFFLLYLI